MVLILSQESEQGKLLAASLSSSLILASVSPGRGAGELGILGADLSSQDKPGEMSTGRSQPPVTPRKVQTERRPGPQVAILCRLWSLPLTGSRRAWHPTPVSSPGKSHGWRRLAGHSPGGRTASDTTERCSLHTRGCSLWKVCFEMLPSVGAGR